MNIYKQFIDEKEFDCASIILYFKGFVTVIYIQLNYENSMNLI